MKLLDQLTRPRQLTKALAAAHNLVSERGEANGSSMAQELISQYQLLDEEQRNVFIRPWPKNSAPTQPAW